MGSGEFELVFQLQSLQSIPCNPCTHLWYFVWKKTLCICIFPEPDSKEDIHVQMMQDF